MLAAVLQKRPKTELSSHGHAPLIGLHVHKCHIRHAQHVVAFIHVPLPINHLQ